MFSFSKQEKIEGDIEYYNLQDWWVSTFSKGERKHIEDVFHPMGTSSDDRTLTKGHISFSSQKAAALLSALAGWFNNSRDRDVAKRIIEKAYEKDYEEAKKGSNILDLHFVLQGMQEIYYRDRDIDPDALAKAIKACEEQIAIAPEAAKAFKKEYSWQELPSHAGYDQLIIVLKKQGKYDKATKLCEQGKRQGWSGFWDKAIEDIKKKKNRSIHIQ